MLDMLRDQITDLQIRLKALEAFTKIDEKKAADKAAADKAAVEAEDKAKSSAKK